MVSKRMRTIQVGSRLLLLTCLTLPGAMSAQNPSPAKNRAPLRSRAFIPLPLGAVKPEGWLRRQLELQASGLTGHLDEFWNDVGPNSGWLGGSGESWERGPYYLDGLLPLAYELDNDVLKKKAQKWIEWTLTHQRADGQFGPLSNNDWWPRMVMLKVLTQYAEVSDDARVIPLMKRYLAFELRELPKRPLQDWGKYRWQDNVYSVLWLYNRTGDSHLLDLARLLHEQGFDWEASFANFKFTGKESTDHLGLKPDQPPTDAAMQTHGVNNAMALKAAPVWWLMTGSQKDREALTNQLAELDRYHGLPNGMFSGDEHFAGRDPSQGIELCAVVESMFSLEEAFAILGDAQLGDRLERIAYNALPATLSNDMWSHQYDQQPNQIACTRAHRQWSTNGDSSNLFGLAPHFGCCTANLHQGWPKFVESLWMKTPDDGLVAVAYAPNRIQTAIKGTQVSVEEQTDYPFRLNIHLTVHTQRAVTFPLLLRVPNWSGGMKLQVNGRSEETPSSRSFLGVSRTWKDGDTLDISFTAQPRASHWYHDAQVFERGPLVFALPLDAQWTELKHYAENSADWQLETKSPWNFAVAAGVCGVKAMEHPIGDVPFDQANPAVTLRVEAKPVAGWSVFENSAGPVPQSPVNTQGPDQALTLVPYGAAKLRITAFPWWKNAAPCSAPPTAVALLDSN
jgi:hypothetical protein